LQQVSVGRFSDWISWSESQIAKIQAGEWLFSRPGIIKIQQHRIDEIGGNDSGGDTVTIRGPAREKFGVRIAQMFAAPATLQQFQSIWSIKPGDSTRVERPGSGVTGR